jgi:hypothetical protein
MVFRCGTAIGPIDTPVTFVDRLVQNSPSYGLSLNIERKITFHIAAKRSLLTCAV